MSQLICSPYFMVFHKEPRLLVDIQFRFNTETLEDQSSPVIHSSEIIQKYMESMLQVKSKIQNLASENILKVQARQRTLISAI